MDGLPGASALGVGTSRWAGTPEQLRALELALDLGCTLVDVAGPAPRDQGRGADVQDAVGRALAHRLAGVQVVTTAPVLDPAGIARRVRVQAGRLRRDRVDVLLLDGMEQLVTDHVDAAASAGLVQAAFSACEELADRGELGSYGVTTARPSGAPFGLARLVGLARDVRRDHRLTCVRLPCDQLLARTGGQPDLVRQAHREGLATVGTRPLPVWPAHGAAPMATCQQHLLDGLDHVLVEPPTEDHLRSVAPLLPGRLGTTRRAG